MDQENEELLKNIIAELEHRESRAKELVEDSAKLVTSFIGAMKMMKRDYESLDDAWKVSDPKSHDAWRAKNPSEILEMEIEEE